MKLKYLKPRFLLIITIIFILTLLFMHRQHFGNTALFIHKKMNKNLSPKIFKICKNWKRKIYVTPEGRLGNLMFIFSAGLGLSLKFNRTLHYGKNFWKTGPCFNINKRFIESNFQSKLSQSITFSETRTKHFSKSIVDNIRLTNKNKRSIHVVKYLQSWKYFDNIFDELRHFFKNHFKTNHVGLKFVENLRKETGRIPVGIHVRLSDTSSDKRLRGGTESYFRTAIKIMKSLIYPHKPIFIIATDDRNRVANTFKNVLFIENHSVLIAKNISNPCVDMEVLSSCNHTIMTHGTFGWWGAFLSNGYNIYIKNFAVEYMYFYNVTTLEDFFFEKWIGLEV